MSLATRELGVQPINGLLVLKSAEITNTCDLKDHNAVVVVDGRHLEKALYDAPRAQICFNDPEGKQRPTKIGCGS